MTKKINIGWQVVAVLAIGVFAFWVASTIRTTYGSAPSGLDTSLGTSSLISVGTTSVATLFTTAPNCTSRVITTVERGIRLSFGSTSPTGQIGHIQAASTTVAYDGGIYGCGMWRAFGYELSSSAPSTTVMTDELR